MRYVERASRLQPLGVFAQRGFLFRDVTETTVGRGRPPDAGGDACTTLR